MHGRGRHLPGNTVFLDGELPPQELADSVLAHVSVGRTG